MRLIQRLLILSCLLALPTFQVSCTSSDDEDVTVLEEEMETLGDGEVEMDDDLGDVDLMDVVDEEDSSLSDLDGEDMDEGDGIDTDFDEEDEFADGGDLDEEFSDAEFSNNDDEFADEDFDEEFEEGNVAKGGDEFDEFSEFEEFEEGGAKDPFAQDEEALAKELGKGDDYPVANNAKPQFPEEVITANPPGGANNPPFVTGQPVPPGGVVPGQPLPPNNGPLITSETQDLMDLPDPIEPTVPNDDMGMADPIVPPEDDEMPEEQNWIPVVKIKKDAFFRNNRLLNAVYIARPDDTVASISEKIYGDDRSKEILADNPHLLKGVDPGDKLYYNSPNRSDDKNTLKFYYDDIGLPAQTYTTRTNDNMRRLGTKLLGFSEGWKEIWAINPQVDSKTILPKGVDLTYWTGNESKKIELVDTSTDNEPEFTPDPIEEEGPTGAGTIDDPFAETELPPEPPLPEAEVAIAPDPTLAPEPADIEAFPDDGIEEAPIPPPQTGTIQSSQADGSLLSIGAIALLIMAGAGLVAIQIKKRKDATAMSPGSLEYTQV